MIKKEIGGIARTATTDVPAIVKHEGKKRSISVMKMRRGGKVYTIWELIMGYIFTSDGYAVETSDGYMIKCNDQ